jgi:hypothetical protein
MREGATVLFHRTRILILFVVLLINVACKKDPAWLSDFRTIMDNVNGDLETIIPMLSQEASVQQVFVALTRLDSTLDYISAETSRVYRQYADMPKQEYLIEKHLDLQFKKLRENAQKVAVVVHYWYKKLKHEKEFNALMRRIGKKINEIGKNTERN